MELSRAERTVCENETFVALEGDAPADIRERVVTRYDNLFETRFCAMTPEDAAARLGAASEDHYREREANPSE